MPRNKEGSRFQWLRIGQVNEWRLAVSDDRDCPDRLSSGQGQRVLADGEYFLSESEGKRARASGQWRVLVQVREIWSADESAIGKSPWFPYKDDGRPGDRHRDEVIWPTWPATLRGDGRVGYAAGGSAAALGAGYWSAARFGEVDGRGDWGCASGRDSYGTPRGHQQTPYDRTSGIRGSETRSCKRDDGACSFRLCSRRRFPMTKSRMPRTLAVFWTGCADLSAGAQARPGARRLAIQMEERYRSTSRTCTYRAVWSHFLCFAS